MTFFVRKRAVGIPWYKRLFLSVLALIALVLLSPAVGFSLEMLGLTDDPESAGGRFLVVAVVLVLCAVNLLKLVFVLSPDGQLSVDWALVVFRGVLPVRMAIFNQSVSSVGLAQRTIKGVPAVSHGDAKPINTRIVDEKGDTIVNEWLFVLYDGRAMRRLLHDLSHRIALPRQICRIGAEECRSRPESLRI